MSSVSALRLRPADAAPWPARRARAVHPRILVVAADRALRDRVGRSLSGGGWQVVLAENGQHALTQLAATGPDAVVLDAALPDIDGVALCRRLRRYGNLVPILIVGASDAVEQRIDGLEAGADDCLATPFDVRELRARLRALVRRGAPATAPPPLAFAELRLDPDRHGVWVDPAFVRLTQTEFQLLELLMLNAGAVLQHGLIYDRVWGYDFGPEANSLRVYIGYLRRKLAGAGARRLIHTVRGVGYVMREP
jgi:two-component system response regulator MprA